MSSSNSLQSNVVVPGLRPILTYLGFTSLGLSLLALGCSSDGGSSSPPNDGAPKPSASQIGAGCQTPDQCDGVLCLTEQSFVGGYCYKECKDDPTACPDGSTCHDYLSYAWCFDACDKDEDCRTGEGYVCDYDVCRPKCTGASACVGEDSCRGGRCEPPCKGDEDCPGGRCQEGDCLPPCKQESECLPGYTCDTASGRCLAKPGKKMGEACTASSQCATGYCLPMRKICSVQCQDAQTCPKQYVCALEKLDQDNNGTADGAESACVPVVGPGGPGSACAKDEDCASSHCYDGFCLEGCAKDEDCALPSLQCVDTRLLVGGGIPTYRGCLPRQGVSFHYDLGSFKAGNLLGFDIPSNASSFIITTEAPAGEIGAIALATDPAGNELTNAQLATDRCKYYSQKNRYAPDAEITSLFVPNTPAVKLVPGIHEFYVVATSADVPVRVSLSLKLGQASKGTLNINWFFLNLASSCVPGPQLDAASAPNHPWFKDIVASLQAIMNQAKITIGQQTYQNLNNPALDVLSLQDGDASPELDALMKSSKGQQGTAINIFLVREIKAEGISGGIILGYGGGIPGPAPLHGTIRSGAVLSVATACFQQYGMNPGHTLAHEIAHHLGLFHSAEQDANPGLDMDTGEIMCPCPCGENMVCQSSWQVSGDWCRGLDHIPDTQGGNTNLMFWAAENTQDFTGNQLTPGQIRVMLDNPLLGH